MLSQLGQNFDSLEFDSAFFLKVRLILQQLAIEKFGWVEEVPERTGSVATLDRNVKRFFAAKMVFFKCWFEQPLRQL